MISQFVSFTSIIITMTCCFQHTSLNCMNLRHVQGSDTPWTKGPASLLSFAVSFSRLSSLSFAVCLCPRPSPAERAQVVSPAPEPAEAVSGCPKGVNKGWVAVRPVDPLLLSCSPVLGEGSFWEVAPVLCREFAVTLVCFQEVVLDALWSVVCQSVVSRSRG